MAFQSVFLSVCVMLGYMVLGFLLIKGKKAENSHAKSFSALLLYVCGPALMISSFQEMDYSLTFLKKILFFCFLLLFIQILFLLVLYIPLRKKLGDPKMRVLTLGSSVGNVGFFGLPVITSLFPGEPIVACYSTVYMLGMNFLVFTIGMYLITNDRQFVSFKGALLNPTSVSVYVALALYLLRIKFPPTVGNMMSLLSKMSTPLCMIVLGMRLASMDFKAIFAQPFAYVVCLLKLVVYPLFVLLLVWFLPFLDELTKVCAYVLSAAPCAAIVLNIAELHNCEQKLCANVVLLTTMLSIITIPLMISWL